MVGCGCARNSTAVSSRSSLIVTPDRLASGTLSFIPRGISFPVEGEGGRGKGGKGRGKKGGNGEFTTRDREFFPGPSFPPPRNVVCLSC